MGSDKYADKEELAYLADFPGADIEDDVVVVRIGDGQVDVSDRDGRTLGTVDVGSVDDPIETALDAALDSAGDDALLVTPDAPLDVSGEPVPVTPEGTFEVKQSGTVRIVPIRPTGVEDSNGDQVDPATEATLSTLAAAVNGNDRVAVDIPNVVDISSRDGRNLGSVDVTDLPDQDVVEHDAADLGADGTVVLELSAGGVENLRGVVSSTGTYDVSVAWQTSTGTAIETVEVVAGATAGEATEIDLAALSPHAVVTVTDTSSAAQTVDGVAHLA